MRTPSRIPIRFYRSLAGREPVLEWLRSLEKSERHAIGTDLMRVQFCWPVGMPLMRSLSGGLWEVRCNLPTRKIARLLLCFHEGVIVVLHGFVKKTTKTPDEDLSLARSRMKEVAS